jgi:mono/diheme cytochrome c family protein
VRVQWFAAAFIVWSAAAVGADVKAPGVDAQVAAGRQIFETSCASSMCHGSGGVGAKGPGFVNANLAFEIIRDAVQNGRPGTPMSAFNGVLDAGMQAQVMAFILSISSGGREPEQLVEIAAPRNIVAPSLADMPDIVVVGGGEGRPARGFSLFYDAARLTGCRTCHRLYGNGGPIGPDFADLKTSAIEIYGAVAAPKMASAWFPGIEILTADGVRHAGIKESETGRVIRYFDITPALPVLRTLPIEHVTATEDLKDGLYDHTALRHSKQELLDLAAFIYASRL